MKMPTNRRLVNAAIAFSLTLVTAAILWQSGWNKGRRDAWRPWTRATPAPSAFTDPATENQSAADYAAKVEALRQEGERAATKGDRRAVANKLYQLGMSAHFRDRGAGDVSLGAYGEALKLLQEAGDTGTIASVLADLSETQLLLGKVDAAEKSLNDALALREAGVGAPSQKADVLNRLGDLLRQRGKYAEAHRVLDRALGLAQELGEFGQQADCLRALGQLAFEEGSPAVARQLLRMASWKYARLGNVESRAAVWGQVGDIALSEGKIDEASDLYERGLSVWQERKQGFWTGRFLARQASVALAKGDLDAAQRLARESLSLLESSNGPVASAWPLFALGGVARRRGDIEVARRFHQQALALRESVDYHWAIRQSQKALAEL